MKRTSKGPLKGGPPPARTASPFFIADFLEQHSLVIAVVLVVLASLRIVSTYTVFNHTFDEPGHIAAGMEWLDRHTFTYEPKHPPLARVATAIGPYLLGIRSQGVKFGNGVSLTNEGTAILYRDHHYDSTLAMARLGILPFFWIACLAVYWWGRRFWDGAVACLAVFFFSFVPPVLAHAGVATTDMAVSAFIGAAFVAGLVWLEQPNARTAALFGACSAMAMLSKMSAVVFLPVCFGCALVWYVAAERPKPGAFLLNARRLLPTFAFGIVVGALVVWATYRFSFGKAPLLNISTPAPEFFAGIRDAMAHNQHGNRSYLLGERSLKGFWYFFPVVLAVKTPLALLFLLVPGAVFALRRYTCGWLPLAFSLGILIVGIYSRINIGVRHILPIYMGFALLGAFAVRALLDLASSRTWISAAVAVLLIWFAGSSLAAHPDYIPYFNELAGSHPENIVVDSDLDWGQDIKRLAARLRSAGATELTYNQFLIADLEREHGFPPIHEMDLARPSPGWNAADLTYLKLCRLGLFDTYPNLKLWPDLIPPTEMAGKTIRLWYFPYPPAAPQ